GEVTFRQDRIPNPARVFIDLPGTKAAPLLVDQTLRFEGDSDVVRQVRIGRHPNNTTRVVLDASGVSSYSVYPLYEPYRIVIDGVRGSTDVPVASVIDTPEPIPTPAPPPAPSRAPLPATPKGLPGFRHDPVPIFAKPSTTIWLKSAPGNVSQHG